MGYRKSNIEFEIINKIGNEEGKNSDIFLAKDIQLNTELVIKQIEIIKFKNIEEYFLEARMLYDCKHTNIMEIQYASRDDEYIYLSMPFFKKGSLNYLMESRYLTVREIIKYSLDFLSGIAYIHSKSLVHLDIKPSNILLDQSNRAVLTDFGLSRYLNNYGIAEQSYIYSLHAEPEFFLYSGRTSLSDIYQIGLTLYRLCNGNDILNQQLEKLGIYSNEELKTAILDKKYPDRYYFLPHIPFKLKKIIKKCLSIDMNERYNNVIQIMNDLSEINKNLDWVYNDKLGELYYLNNNNNRIVINIEKINNRYNIVCTKTNLKSGKTTNMNRYSSRGYKTYSRLSKEIEKIIKDND